MVLYARGRTLQLKDCQLESIDGSEEVSAGRSQDALPAEPHRCGETRILHTVSSLKIGGMENFVIRLAALQKARGHDVAVLALDPGPLAERAANLGLKFAMLGPYPRLLRLARGLSFIAAHRPQIIHAHNATSLHYAAAGKKLTGAKLVFTDHGVVVMRQPSPWEIRATDALVAVSEQTATDHGTAYGRPLHFNVIHNGVEASLPRRTRGEMRRELRLPDGITVVNVARLEPVKGHDTLIKALAILQHGGTPVNLLIAGDGSEREALEQMARKCGLTPERVRFLGFRTDVPDLLTAADLFALSSRDEGLPLALLEAMVHKLPIVATAVGGVPELVTHGKHGFVIPPQSPEAMAEAIGTLAHDPDLCRRMGEAGARHVTESFSFSRTAARYEALYCTLRTRQSVS